MPAALLDTLRSLRRSPIFAFYALATLVTATVIGLMTVNVIDIGMDHFGDPSHRVHDVAYGLLFTTLVVGVAVQLRRPERNVSAMVMALIPPAALLLTGLLIGDVDAMLRFNPIRNVIGIVAVAALVHPAGRAFFRSFTLTRASRPMLGLVAVTAVPLIGFASTNLRLQRTVIDLHGKMGHYGFLAALAFTIIAVGTLASLRADGWRVPAWVAGLLPIALGLASVLSPDAASSLAPGWAIAATAWGVTFIAAAELTRHRATSPKRPSGPAGGHRPAVARREDVLVP